MRSNLRLLYSSTNRSVVRSCNPASRKRQSCSTEAHHEGHCWPTYQSSVQRQDSKYTECINKLQKNIPRYPTLYMIYICTLLLMHIVHDIPCYYAHIVVWQLNVKLSIPTLGLRHFQGKGSWLIEHLFTSSFQFVFLKNQWKRLG